MNGPGLEAIRSVFASAAVVDGTTHNTLTVVGSQGTREETGRHGPDPRQGSRTCTIDTLEEGTMKSSKTMILMVVAVGCGLVASFLTSRLLAERGNSGPVMVKRLVAKKNLALGTVIKDPEKYFVEKEF